MMHLREKVISGMLWSFAERFGAQAVSFIVSIVLARMLEPCHYGAIALVSVFINIANVFATGGFGNSLIQKKSADNVDFSTVFYFNIAWSVVLYAVIFVAAPLISRFYTMPELTPVVRIMGIRLIVAGINSVQRAYVSRNMLFKRFFFSTLGGTLLSALVGVYLAYKGFGVWALVAQYMINTCTDTVVLWITVKWRPDFVFSFTRLKQLFSFGWKLLCSTLLTTIYTELTELVIGKVYGSSDLAYYNKGKKFPQLIVTQINSALDTVLFPAMAKHQDNREMLKQDVRYSIKFASFCVFPVVFGLAAIGNDLIRILLTDKWKESIIYLQIACISYAILPIGLANIQAIKAMGRSDIYLKLDIIKKVIGIGLLIVFVKNGVIAIAIAEAVSNILGLVINVYPNRKLLNYTGKELLKDILPALMASSVMVICVLAVEHLAVDLVLRLVLQVLTGGIAYIVASQIFKVPAYAEAKKLFVQLLRKKTK